MKYLKKYNESSVTDENLLEELTDMFRTHFLDISDESRVTMYYCYYHGPISNNQLQRVDFTYSYKDIKRNRNITKEQFNKFVDENEDNFRLVFHAGFSAITYDIDDMEHDREKIQGYNQLGEPIIDVDVVCKTMKFLAEQLPMIVNRLKDEFEDVIVNISTVGSEFEISAFCDKETTKKVGLIPGVVQDSRVFIE